MVYLRWIPRWCTCDGYLGGVLEMDTWMVYLRWIPRWCTCDGYLGGVLEMDT